MNTAYRILKCFAIGSEMSNVLLSFQYIHTGRLLCVVCTILEGEQYISDSSSWVESFATIAREHCCNTTVDVAQTIDSMYALLTARRRMNHLII